MNLLKAFSEIRPRKVLLGGTAFGLFTTSMCIVTLMALLFGGFSSDRELHYLGTIRNIVKNFGQQFEKAFVDVHMKEMQDQMDLVTALLGSLHESSTKELNKRMEQDVRGFANAIDTAAAKAKAETLGRLLEGLLATKDTLSTLHVPLGTPMELQGVLRALTARHGGGTDVFATELGTGTVVIPSSSLSAFPSSLQYTGIPCLQGHTGITLDTVHPSGTLVGAAHTSIGPYAVCVTIPATKLNEAAVSQAQHVVDVINKGRGEGHLHRSLRLADEMPQASGFGPVHVHIAPVLQSSLFLVESQGYEQTVEAARQEIISAFDFINFEFTRTTELVVSRIDPETKRFDCHATKFRFNKTCAEDCYRTQASCANAFATYQNRRNSRGITPDYRPEPVLGAFTWLKPLSLSLGIERDVLEVRQLALKELKKLLDTSNSAFNKQTSLRLHLLHYAGNPAMPTFDSTLPCSSHGDAGCFQTNIKSNEIVLINYNCIDCMRQPLNSADSIEYLTDLRLSTDCHKGDRRKCAAASRKLSSTHQIIMSSQGLITSTRDYTGHEVMIGHSFIDNLNVALYAKMDLQEVEGPIARITRDSALYGVALCIGGLVVVMLICGGMLGRIEREYQTIVDFHASEEAHTKRIKDLHDKYFLYMCRDARSPLNVLLTIVENVLSLKDVNQAAHDQLTVALREGKYFCSQLDEMVLHHSMQFDELKIDIAPFHLKDAIEHVEQTARSSATSDSCTCQLSFHTDLESLPDVVFGDRSKITQMWRAMVQFAMRGTTRNAEGCPLLSLKVNIYTNFNSGRRTTINFEMVMEGDVPSPDLSTGLFEMDGGEIHEDRVGLVVARQLARRMEGDIWVKAAGCRPGITLCIVSKVTVDVPKMQDTRSESQDSFNEHENLELNGLRLLFVENDPLSVLVITQFCRQLNVRFTHMSCSDQDDESIVGKASDFDVVLLNCDIPEIKILALRIHDAIPVIGLTMDPARLGMRRRFARFLVPPVTQATLEEVLTGIT